jgi:hypothetical protein
MSYEGLNQADLRQVRLVETYVSSKSPFRGRRDNTARFISKGLSESSFFANPPAQNGRLELDQRAAVAAK